MIHPIFLIDTDRCTQRMKDMMHDSVVLAKKMRSEFLTPEHLLYTITFQHEFYSFCEDKGIDIENMRNDLDTYIENIDKVPKNEDYLCMNSLQLQVLMQLVEECNNDENEGIAEEEHTQIDIIDVMIDMTNLDDSYASNVIDNYIGRKMPFWTDVLEDYYIHDITASFDTESREAVTEMAGKTPIVTAEAYVNGKKVDLSEDEMYDKLMQSAGRLMASLHALGADADVSVGDAPKQKEKQKRKKEPWEEMVTCLNETYKKKNPLIGREQELTRTTRILCRRDKNNPLFIGEPGVGKTALIYGLTRMIEEGNVPEWMQGMRIYALDMGTLIAGASYHGEFERRIKEVLEGAHNQGNCILYIDEIHTICDAGGGGNGNSMNAADMLKPYLEDGTIRFIGSTTYKDYNKTIANNKAIARRFGQIDIKEPSVSETVQIVTQLLPIYELHHGVKYMPEAVQYAVEQSDALIHDRFLPDKAIDIIDEAGAYRQQNLLLNKEGKPKVARYQKIDKTLIKTILTEVCRIDAKALSSESNDSLRDLDKRIASNIYGQDEAIKQVVRAVMMSKAGLMEPDKPLASLLFVGPTGVGKTEVCKVLAQELGIELVRFDMSEYTEKHTISKLIGSPAGYVGYDEGGLLTDAIRKTPNCVLLLDEIEKAHSDIYNILLQVMDYARLTDNKGNKADFRNVILIMTSNAGAQFAGQAGVGFGGGQTKGQAMMQTVKKTFKPEFLNRLSGTVVFNEMDHTMASLILDKKLRQLSKRLEAKNVTMTITDGAHDFLLEKGFTSQYGAREMDRAIQQHLTPLLMDEILFGRLKKGGDAVVDVKGDSLELR